jgi:SAM-dependent methyltransferase
MRKFYCNNLLDFGTGTGVYSFFATRDPLCQCIALDIDAKRIESIQYQAILLNRNNLKAITFHDAALDELPLQSFSVVLAIEVLQYIPELRRTLIKLKERLRPGGVFIAHIPRRDSLWQFERNMFDDASLRQIMTEAGFEALMIRDTFGHAAVILCEIYSRLAERPILLAFLYPWLLICASLTPRFVSRGSFCLLVARRPF